MMITVELVSGRVQRCYKDMDFAPQASEILGPYQARCYLAMCLAQRSMVKESAKCWKK